MHYQYTIVKFVWILKLFFIFNMTVKNISTKNLVYELGDHYFPLSLFNNPEKSLGKWKCLRKNGFYYLWFSVFVFIQLKIIVDLTDHQILILALFRHGAIFKIFLHVLFKYFVIKIYCQFFFVYVDTHFVIHFWVMFKFVEYTNNCYLFSSFFAQNIFSFTMIYYCVIN